MEFVVPVGQFAMELPDLFRQILQFHIDLVNTEGRPSLKRERPFLVDAAR